MTPRLLIAAMIALLGTWHSTPIVADTTADDYREMYLKLDGGIGESLELHGQILENSLRPPACLETSFQQASSTLRRLRKTLQSESCDWEIDMSAGLNADLSHLSMVRTFARMIAGDARRAMAIGDSERVAEQIANMIRLVNHVGPDFLLSSLIKTALLKITNTLIQEADSRALISMPESHVILKVAGRLDADDPTGFHGALESEKSLSESLVDEFFGMASPGDPEMDLNSPGDSETDAQQVEALRLFFEQIEMEVDIEGWQDEAPNQIRANVDRYWRDVFRTWSNRRSQSFVQECQALDEKVANDEYGPYMSLMGAALGNALQQTAQQNQIFQSDIDLLKSIESGTRTENQTINAAFLYMRIVNEIQNDPEWRSNPATIAEITRLLQEAVHCEVSRFPNPEDLSITLQQPVLLWTAPTIPWWLPEIDRVLGWLIETGDDDGLKKMDGDSIARLETAVLVITDLCEDLNISSSVVAAARTNQVLDVIQRWQLDGIPAEEASRLLMALREIPTRDPFGIRVACDQTRLRLSMHLENLAERDLMPTQILPAGPEGLMYATAWIRDLPEYTSTKSGFDLECQWPDGASATACPPLRQSSIDSAAQDGLQIMEAWELELAIQLEPAANICETDLDILIDDARARLLKIRRSLRDSLASKSSTE